MNIKEHIEAGHYPTDEKGRALVPHKEGGHALALQTDGPGKYPITGWRVGPDGDFISLTRWEVDAACLLPPPPRKVKVTRWLVVTPREERGPYLDEVDAKAFARGIAGGFVVELHGEYEVTP